MMSLLISLGSSLVICRFEGWAFGSFYASCAGGPWTSGWGASLVFYVCDSWGTWCVEVCVIISRLPSETWGESG